MGTKAILVLTIVFAVCFCGYAAAADLEITPAEDFDPSGEPGGPFTPAAKNYQLKNIGPNSLYWGVSKTVDWLNLEPEPLWGQLEPNESNVVTVSLSPEANSLGEGVHTDTVTFIDMTNEIEQTRGVTLTISVPGGIWLSPSSFDVNVIEGCRLTQNLTIGNEGAGDLDFMVRTRVVAGSGGESTATGGGISSVPEDHDFAVVGNSPYKSGELIVRFAGKANGKGRNNQEKNQILGSLGGGVIKRNFEIVPGLSLVKLPAGTTVEEALHTFNKAHGILYAEPNYEVKAISTFPNDTRFNDLWGMHNTGQTGGLPDADIDAPEAWDMATGSSEIVVAVIDTGVDYTHVDLAANMWVNEDEFYGTPGVDDDGNGYVDDIYGYDFCNYDPDPMDDHYHGTHCSGTVGAVGNNGEGVAGVCWDVKIMALKFLDAGGSGWTDDAIKCVEYSALMGANLSSNSWGGGSYSQALKDAIDAAGAAGMLFAAAAGNDDENTDDHPHYPSSYDCESLISVMATNHSDNKSGFSNWGPVSVDLGAPGSDILSCKLGGGYKYAGGTSMATPHVAGACALLWSMDPALSNSEVKDILLRTVDVTLSGLCVSEGRLNLYNAILETRAPWIYMEPEEGTIGPGDSNEISVTFDAMELAPGTYEAEIVVISNDPCNPTKVVPVAMTVSPDDLSVVPDEDFESSGTKGGPFEPQCMTYTLTNNGVAPVSWTTFEIEDWLEVEPNEGVLDPNETIDVNVCISPNADLLEPNLYTQTLTFQNTDSNSIKPRQVTLTVSPPDCFTESFDEGGADLEGLMLTFTPDGSIAYYEACREKVTEFPIDPNGGTYVALWDDDFVEVMLSESAEILFHGQWYDRFYIGSNGYITFGQGDTEYSGSLENHFNMPRISSLFADLNPPDDECISYKQLEDGVVVTFEEVPLYGDKDSKNSFQIEVFFVDGTIRISWLELAEASSVAGLSEGSGLAPILFEESDLSEYPPCWALGDFDRDYLVNFKDFAVLGAHWRDGDCNIPYWCGKTDLDRTGTTDENDLCIFAENWLTREDWFLQPIAHWKFDEGEGDTAYDSVGDRHGTVYGAQWTTGQIDGALWFDGLDDYIALPDNDPVWLPQYNFTVSVWVHFERDPGAHELILDLNYAASADPTYELGYCILRAQDTAELWFQMTTTTNSDEDLFTDYVLQKNTWYHIVAVRDGTTQAVYIDGEFADGRTCAPDPIDFVGGYDDDKVNIGRYTRTGGASSYLKGKVDDVRIYERALSDEEIWQLYQDGLGGEAYNPNPADGAGCVDPNTVLSWSPGKDAVSHDVYFGTDYDDVNDANTLSSEYMGNQDANSWDPCGLDYDSTYYWRVDEVGLSETYKGDVWSFTTWAESYVPGLVSRWKFDEGEGDTAYDSVGNNHGTVHGAEWTTGQIDGALSFDGVGDYVRIADDPSLRFTQYDSFSICYWAMPLHNALNVIGKYRGGGQSGIFGYMTGWSPPRTSFYFAAEKSYVGKDYAFTPEDSAPVGNWYHVMCVYDNKNMEIFLNGESAGSGTFSYDTGSTTPDNDLTIGARFWDSTFDWYFHGTIDDVRIYDRALSDEEIWQLHQDGLN